MAQPHYHVMAGTVGCLPDYHAAPFPTLEAAKVDAKRYRDEDSQVRWSLIADEGSKGIIWAQDIQYLEITPCTKAINTCEEEALSD